MSTTPPTPPEPEGPGPAFPGFKMGMGAPEHSEVPDFGEYRSHREVPYASRSVWPRVVSAVAVLIVVALLLWLVLA